MCRQILQASSNQYVLFQTGCCLKAGVIRDFSTLGREGGEALFKYLFEYVNTHPVDNYVVEEFMLVGSVLLKRILIDDVNKPEFKTLITTLLDLIKNPCTPMSVRMNTAIAIKQILGKNLLLFDAPLSLVLSKGEFVSIIQNSDFGLSWYNHLIAKKHFEKYRLKEVFEAVVKTLFEHMQLDVQTRQNNPEWIRFATKLVQICDMVLSWNFNFAMESFSLISVSNYYSRNQDRLEAVIFQPPPDWIDFVIELVPFFFEVYLSCRSLQDATLTHHSLQCLNQLSTMSCPSFCRQRDNRKQFMETFMRNSSRLVSMLLDVMNIDELVTLSNMINSVCNHLRAASSFLPECDLTMIRTFLAVMAKMTCKVIQESVHFNVALIEENIDKCNLSIDYLLSAWSIVLNVFEFVHQLKHELPDPNVNYENFISMDEVVKMTKSIFEMYLKSHLCEPQGFLPLSYYMNSDEIQV